jgi:hypothetical protein
VEPPRNDLCGTPEPGSIVVFVTDQLQKLQGVLHGKLIEVADYQRPYAWGTKQLEDLWQDLDLLGTDSHYAGTLVLQRTERVVHSQQGEDLVVFEVVDGQQRLTTCVILLDQIARAMGRLLETGFADPDLSETRRDLDRLVRVKVNGAPRPRLALGAELHEFFERSILGDTPTNKVTLVAGEQRLDSAARFFAERIEKLAVATEPEETARRLQELSARVSYRLSFLVYQVTSSAEVGVLFETLNDRGQSLSDLEKVKNYLLYLSRQLPEGMSQDLASKINSAWSKIFANMAHRADDDDALLRAHWFLTFDPIQRNWERSASIKRQFPRASYVPTSGRIAGGDDAGDAISEDVSSRLFDEISEYVESLHDCSAFFRDIYEPPSVIHAFGDHRLSEKVARQSRSLVRTGSVANFRPILLAARLKYPHNGELYLRLLRLAETFSARAYVICVVRANAGQAQLYRAAHELFTGASPDAVIESITAQLWRLAPDEAVRAGLGAGVEWYYRRGHKYVLYEYELGIAGGSDDLPPWGEATAGGNKTTEHILPQNPSADSRWWSDFTREQHAELLNSLGNLVLTRNNSAYSNKDYVAKRGVAGSDGVRSYSSTSALGRERELAHKFPTWTPENVEMRRQSIEDWALERWRVDAPALAALQSPGEADTDIDIDEPIPSAELD